MKRLLVLVIISVYVLTGCGQVAQKMIEDEVLYTHQQLLTHSMEGVELEMNYTVHQLQELSDIQQQQEVEQGSVIIEGNATLNNTTDRTIYYTPNFTIQTETGEHFDNIAQQLGYEENTEQYEVASGQEKAFHIVFNLPKTSYDQITELEFFVPVAFKEPGSVSSGDALGDTAMWQLPIK